jgi:hypothetical protein
MSELSSRSEPVIKRAGSGQASHEAIPPSSLTFSLRKLMSGSNFRYKDNMSELRHKASSCFPSTSESNPSALIDKIEIVIATKGFGITHNQGV